MAAGCMPSRMFYQSTSCEYSRVLQSTGRGTANGKGVPVERIALRCDRRMNSTQTAFSCSATRFRQPQTGFHIVRCKLAFPEVCWNM